MIKKCNIAGRQLNNSPFKFLSCFCKLFWKWFQHFCLRKLLQLLVHEAKCFNLFSRIFPAFSKHLWHAKHCTCMTVFIFKIMCFYYRMMLRLAVGCNDFVHGTLILSLKLSSLLLPLRALICKSSPLKTYKKRERQECSKTEGFRPFNSFKPALGFFKSALKLQKIAILDNM